MAPKVSEQYKQERKMELVQAARRVFIRKGYTQATMQDIMDEAGVSRGALYSYFANLQDAFLEVLQSEDEQELSFFSYDNQAPLWPQFIQWISHQQTQIENIKESLLLARAQFFLSLHDGPDDELSTYIRLRQQKVTQLLTRFIDEGVMKKEFQPRAAAESIARYYIFFVDGLMLNTFQLGTAHTQVREQMALLLSNLREMICPAHLS